jgi:hypothetical protein
MRRVLLFGLLLLVAAVLATCGSGYQMEGIAGFSDSSQAAVITDGRLFLWDLASGDSQEIEVEAGDLLPGFGASLSRTGDVLYASQTGTGIQVCVFRTDMQQSTCRIALEQGSDSGGLLSYLPDGNLVVVYGDRVQVYTDEGERIGLAADATSFLPVRHIFKFQRGQSRYFYTKPYATSGCAQEQKLQWIVIQENNKVYRYTIGASAEEPPALPREITEDVRAMLEIRLAADWVTLSPDASRLVIKTLHDPSDWSAGLDLFVLDLETNSGEPTLLVEGADFGISYSFSPCGDQLAYESNADGHSVWILDFASGVSTKLADGASLPLWYAE